MPCEVLRTPLAFQCIITSIFHGLLNDSVFALLGDNIIIIVSKDMFSHVIKMEDVVMRLERTGSTLKLTKWKLSQKKNAFLGHVLNAEGVHTKNKKVKAIQSSRILTNLKTFDHF